MKYVPLIVFMKVKTCWSYIRMSVLIVGSASLNVRLMLLDPDTEPDMEDWVEFNRKYSEIWPVILEKKDAPPDAESHEFEEGKMEKYFSEKPGEGS